MKAPKNLQQEYKKRRRLHLRLKFQLKALACLNRLAIYVLVLLLVAGSFAFSFPQYKALDERKEILEEALAEERKAIKLKDEARRENRALQEGLEYMELKARDLLDYYKPGEVIFDVNRESRSDPEEK